MRLGGSQNRYLLIDCKWRFMISKFALVISSETSSLAITLQHILNQVAATHVTIEEAFHSWHETLAVLIWSIYYAVKLSRVRASRDKSRRASRISKNEVTSPFFSEAIVPVNIGWNKKLCLLIWEKHNSILLTTSTLRMNAYFPPHLCAVRYVYNILRIVLRNKRIVFQKQGQF